METLYLDTHIVIWLREKAVKKLSPFAINAIEQADKIAISPMAALEMQYLYEINRLIETADSIIEDLSQMIGLFVDDKDYYASVQKAYTLKWTRDPFDRMISAQAILSQSVLLTKDETILQHCEYAAF